MAVYECISLERITGSSVESNFDETEAFFGNGGTKAMSDGITIKANLLSTFTGFIEAYFDVEEFGFPPSDGKPLTHIGRPFAFGGGSGNWSNE